MFRVEVHIFLRRIIAIFHFAGVWHRQDKETAGQRILKWFYLFLYSLFPISLMVGAVTDDEMDGKIFLFDASTIAAVSIIKLWQMIRKKREILQFLKQTCEYDIEDRATYTEINDKLNSFMIFVKIFICVSYYAMYSCSLIAPFVVTERKLFAPIGFPLDYENDEFAFWMALTFTVIESTVIAFIFLYSVIIWFLLANCSWRYEILGHQMVKMGEVRVAVNEGDDEERKISNVQRDNLYVQDLLGAITTHNYLKELTNKLDSFFSNVFAGHLTTSAFCLCASSYNLAISKGGNFIELFIYFGVLLYNTFDIFMLTYFGNEIKLASDKLSYRLFESNWVDRSQSVKKNVLIFGEFLMQPDQLFVLKLYPLTLETFTRILNLAYSMFNILKSLV